MCDSPCDECGKGKILDNMPEQSLGLPDPEEDIEEWLGLPGSVDDSTLSAHGTATDEDGK